MSRLAITTTSDRSAPLAQTCREHGLAPVVLPCIGVVPAPEEILRSAREEAARADWLVVTSSRTVGVLWPNGDMPVTKAAAVGRSTAEAIREGGGSVVVVGDGGARRLVDGIRDALAAKSVFFPHSAGTDPAVVDALGESAAELVSTAVYDIRPIAPADDEVDGVTFGSPTAVEGWTRSRALEELTVGVIGPTTAAALDAIGIAPDVMPARPSFEHLIRLMAGRLIERSRA